MSITSRLIHDIKLTSDRIGGATCTRVARKRHGRKFAKWYYAHASEPAACLGEIDVSILPDYAQFLRGSLSIGTTHNHLASVRELLRAAKVDLGEYVSNRSLGLGSRSRKGKKEPYPDELLPDLLVRARELDEGLYHVLKLERLLGCRGLESLMSAQSLSRWVEELTQIGKLRIEDGTKGGRSRWTEIIDCRAEETREAIVAAYEYIQRNTFFISGGKKGLGSARQKYHRLTRTLGLVGKWSPHSLRYAWAVEKIMELIQAGYSRREILGFVSAQLGHGDTRGRWVKSVYGQTVSHLLPPPSSASKELYERAMALKGR